MKIKKINKKMALNKQLIARLNGRYMNEIKGGDSYERSCDNMPPCMILPTGKCPSYACN